MALSAGKRPHFVEVEAHNGLENRRGELDPAGWHRVAEAWVGIESQAGTTAETGGLETSTVTATMRGLYDDLTGITPTMRIRWVDRARVRLFEIESAVDVGELGDEMRIVVREISPANDDPAAAELPAEVGAA